MADKTVVVRAVYRSNVAQGMRQDAGAISSLSANVESAAGKTSSSVRNLGAASAIAGKLMVLGIGGAMAVSAKAAIDFESSMAGVAKTTDLAGNSFEQNSGPLFQFGEALRSLALRTPINVNELAGIAELGGQLGIETGNLIDFTETMAELGVSTNLSAEEAAKGFARFANIMRTPQDEFRRLGSVVVELGNNLATTEGEILKFATRIAPVARTVGATEEEVFALAGALSSLGIPAQRGGSAVQRWFINAKEAVDDGGESLEQFAKVTGRTGDEFAELFRESPGQAFVEFASGLDELNQSGGDVFGTLDALGLSSIRVTQVMLAAAGGAETLDEAMGLANEEGETATALQEEAARRFGTTASQIQLLGNAFNDLRIEVGNAVLGSGGLAFALDVAREFFGIIKDNLGVIQGFATVAGILVTIRLGVFFFQAAQNAQQAIGAFRGAASAAGAMSISARVAQGGMLALTGAMQGALGIAGLLAAAWSFMAIEAAKAKAQAEQLRQEMEQGADPVEVMADRISEIASETQLRQLAALGFSVEDIARFLMDGEPAASEFGQALDETGQSFFRVKDLVKEARGEVESFMNVRVGELRNSMIEAQVATEKTVSELDRLGRRGIQELGFDVSDEEFLEWVRLQLGGMNSMERSARASFAGIRGEIEATEGSWQEYIKMLDAEGGGDVIEGFTDDNLEAVVEFREKMDEEFDRIGETIRDGMPVWGEYEQAVIGATDEAGNRITPTLREALRAQELFLEDTRDFVERMPDILEMGASADTVSWLESMEAPIRGAISRLNDAQLQELIDGANANFDALQELHMQRWMQVYPDNANLAFGAMVGELAGRVDEMNLPGELAGDAFADGIMDMMAAMPEENRDQFLTYLTELFENDEWMENNGFDSGDNWVVGLLNALAGMSDRVNPIVSEEAGKIKVRWKALFREQSPSKFFQESGENMVAGLEVGLSGMAGVFNKFDPNRLMPSMMAGSGAMSSVTNNRNANYNLTVNGGGNSNNINSEAQTLLTLLTIVGGVEQGAGR